MKESLTNEQTNIISMKKYCLNILPI